ncbi:MAG: glycosyltransferase family 4 protein [Desulfomonile tiedjei]|nr:glycosyltransferase family 4 protein [Desulfomonile tiedjei]
MTLPRTAYVLLWFPKPSETFIFREAVNLRRMGLPLQVFTLYGELTAGLSAEMRAASSEVERLGIPLLTTVAGDLRFWRRRNPKLVGELLRTVPFRRWNGIEKGAENFWAFLCAFHLARRFEEEHIQHIHAPWASGPATAAWIASRLTGKPFSFTARAWDIYPADGALGEKMRDAAFVRSETGTNIPYLAGICPEAESKIHLTYNGVPLIEQCEAPVTMRRPVQLLAIGRFVGKKGYDYLLRGCSILADRGIDFRLTLAGDGPRGVQLKALAKRLGLGGRIRFPGFVLYDSVSALFCSSDVLIVPSVVHASGDRDGIPTVIMESLMHRVPVIATDVSGIPEVIENERTGLLIPEKDPEAIADAVLTMVADRDRALAMAERGRARVRETFDPERCHRKVLDLYERLVPLPGDTGGV